MLQDALSRDTFDLVLLGGPITRKLLESTVNAIRSSPGRPDVIVISEGEDAEEQARLLAAGCLAVVPDSLGSSLLRKALLTLLARRREISQRLNTAEERDDLLRGFVASSASMRSLLETARQVAASKSSVLILGETGVGKEWLARLIHLEGPRRDGPFVPVNCGAIPEGLAESELFGHVTGAFTGAIRNRRGYFELAHTGTLFLDEFVDMAAQIQVKVLRALQERRFQPLGAEEAVSVDIRVIAATNKNPEAEIKAGRLRPDLYYRVGVIELTIPPLRERPEDLAELVPRFFEDFIQKLGRPLRSISDPALEALRRYAWPGNVRELINVMERAVLLCKSTHLGLEDLPRDIARGSSQAVLSVADVHINPLVAIHKGIQEARREILDAFDRGYLETLLKEFRGHVGDVAKRAGITRRALFGIMRRLGIDKDRFR